MRITNRLLHTIRKYKMISEGDCIVVAVSGGSDSVGLLHLLSDLKSYRPTIIAAHFNHKLRGKESDSDAAFVEKLAKKLGVVYEYGEAREFELEKKTGVSQEDAARNLRYGFLKQVVKKHKAHKIATAHTEEDQAETVLMRLLRGSGSHGLSGIPPVNGNIIRPLIETQKTEIREFLKSKKIRWRDDSTNLSTEFLRNRIRLELIPLVEKMNPGINRVLQRTSEILSLESGFISSCVNEVFTSVVKKKPFGFIGNRKKFLNLDKALRLGILRKTIEYLKGDLKTVSAIHLLNIDEMIESEKSSGEVILPEGIRFNLGYQIFCLSEKSNFNENYSYRIDKPGVYKMENGLKLSIEKTSKRADWRNESVGFFSTKKVNFPIFIRNYRPGDRFRPLGLKGFKKVKDFYIDQKVPRFLRKKIPVFETADGIIWLGGLRNDERFKVGKNDTEFLSIKVSMAELKLLKKF